MADAGVDIKLRRTSAKESARILVLVCTVHTYTKYFAPRLETQPILYSQPLGLLKIEPVDPICSFCMLCVLVVRSRVVLGRMLVDREMKRLFISYVTLLTELHYYILQPSFKAPEGVLLMMALSRAPSPRVLQDIVHSG